jgi:hypothetical protein
MVDGGAAFGLEVDGEGSKPLRLLVIPRTGSTGNHLASGRENTSVQKTGGVVNGSGDAVTKR